jgi:hypothetical protein
MRGEQQGRVDFLDADRQNAMGGTAMIDSALDVIRKKLNDYLHISEPGHEERVILSNFFDNDGKPEAETENKLVMTILNIEQETAISTYNRSVPSGNNSYNAVNAPININIKFIISANFKANQYKNGLKSISKAIYFFQGSPIFTHENSPGISPEIDRLSLELVNINEGERSGLLRAIEAKGLPFVIYKMRTLCFRGAKPQVEASLSL